MAGLEKHLAEAEAALGTLDEAVPRGANSLIERDAAIFRLVYTFALVCRACRRLLAEREGVRIAAANEAIAAAHRSGWLSDEDAEAAVSAARDRELAFEMYRPNIGDAIGSRLASHAAV